LVARKLDL